MTNRRPPAPPAKPDPLRGLAAVADWVTLNLRASATFDDDAFDIADSLMKALIPHTEAGRKDEMQAALMKVLVAVLVLDVRDGSDEDVFKLSTALREDFYSEVMQLRRAMLQDSKDKGP